MPSRGFYQLKNGYIFMNAEENPALIVVFEANL